MLGASKHSVYTSAVEETSNREKKLNATVEEAKNPVEKGSMQEIQAAFKILN